MTELFNKKTIERLCSNIEINSKQRKAAKEWLELLKSDSLRDEVKNYPNFELIILQDLLGYDLKKSLSHEEGNIEFPFKDDSGKFIIGFEAKGTDTKDLFAIQAGRKKEHESPVKQLWDYMGGKLDLQYGAVTNYKDFILLDKTKGYSKYHFFDFTEIEKNENKLKEFIAIFSKESIIDKKFLEELYSKSVIEEREFTKEFYKLFHETRLMLIKEFQDNKATKEDAIHYAQIFLNRLMFVFFTEDTGKLESRIFEKNIIPLLETKNILSEGTDFACGRITNLFEKLNLGSDSEPKIFGFNGGLFKEEIPRNIYFKDLRQKNYFKEQMQYSNLKKHPKLNEAEQQLVNTYKDKLNPIISNMLIMASYDFKTEVNVNILGHIFEQSLTDLEELKEGEISKRKKEGVYYTPEYITEYICKNTIIPYLSKKDSSTVEELLNEYKFDISELEKKFKEIKILDPACGSGAFLIKAVDILLEIQKGIQELKQQKGTYSKTVGKGKKKVEGIISLAKWWEEDEAREIIENNIFGVDINEESVEITKLSLFLKIARKNKKLIDLSQNIKCGNSLIDDSTIDNKAFNWQNEFKTIFDKGGFDVIIGNPPYIPVEIMSVNEKKYYLEKFESLERKYDSSAVFILNSLALLSKRGLLSFISSITWQTGENYKKFREKLIKSYGLAKILNLPFNVFKDAYVDTGIYIFLKVKKDYFNAYQFDKREKIVRLENLDYKKIKITDIVSPDYKIVVSKKIISIQGKIRSLNTVDLGEITISTQGLSASRFKLSEGTQKNNMPFLFQGQGYRYFLVKEKIKNVDMNEHQNLIKFYKKEPKILIRRIINRQNRLMACYLDEELVFKKDLNPFILTNSLFETKYVLAILNSSLISYLYTHFSTIALKDDFRQTTLAELKKIPIVAIDLPKQKEIIEIVDFLRSSLNQFENKRNKFLSRLNAINVKQTKKILDFFKLDFKEFYRELEKQKVKLSLKEQDEWEDYFNEYKKELLELKEKIDEADKEIDEMVYLLYGLTKEEIKIVEDSVGK